MAEASSIIRITTALIMNLKGDVLLVRKAGTTAFMQAGGKLDSGETPRQALARELKEELSLEVEPDVFDYLGSFSAPAANEPGWSVEAECFYLLCPNVGSPEAEIEEVLWVDPFSLPEIELAPLTRDYILPLARKRRQSCPAPH
ncbi:NUDIX domain-containing protein [Acetobacter tropicalis]|uniref:Nudix hydrolase family protein n=1 Tax=Acetobacter tropicalis TaxID=104102 RepID=A0A095BCE6_9PROT|nr:NUDIX domain-containing protein [Acetobacter tropicalis]KAA8390420.1 NUDIX domain-containing protein [Acetobacter tropicalis]KAA8391711.1 NUDIX domain-containing protein [Acetobacter tropicalis]KGB26483.1 Nudix hydrolase family protein [Acetobacter tropicalis]MBC9010002.1 NUDIX domain-containing protein [Acetobacter tropicalis]MDO8173112.1 NUDIX domain-containing protein [Acetobacter tropicalis]